jgi:hypothetical protein
MSRTIVYILGTSFSGSSLLNSLLDAQPATRGLGEAVHLIDKPTNAWCSHCRKHIDQCQLQSNIDRDAFYQSAFRYYADAEVLVNSSKHWGLCFGHMPLPPREYRLRLIILSKSLQEFSYSYAAHNACDWREGFTKWTEFYERLFFHLDQPQASETHREIHLRLRPKDIYLVTYRKLATDPLATVHSICRDLDLPFDPTFRSRLWQSDTCMIGGNNAIYAQQTNNGAFFSASEYLGGKYNGRQRDIFYDDAWLSCAPLQSAAAQFRCTRGETLDRLEQRLGQALTVQDVK